jgi:hypothetical protein
MKQASAGAANHLKSKGAGPAAVLNVVWDTLTEAGIPNLQAHIAQWLYKYIAGNVKAMLFNAGSSLGRWNQLQTSEACPDRYGIIPGACVSRRCFQK